MAIRHEKGRTMLVLDGLTALEYWMSDAAMMGRERIAVSLARLTDFDSLSGREMSRRMESLGARPGALELLVRSPDERRESKWVRCRAWGHRPLPPGSIVEAGDRVAVISPEICAIRLAAILPPLPYFRALSGLLGIYVRKSDSHLDLLGRDPITSIEDILTCLEQTGSIPGSKLARMALGWVIEGSASPRETTMDVSLAMPTRLGGHGLGNFKANWPIELTASASGLTKRSYLVSDVIWEKKRLVVEYNSSKHHDTLKQKEMDFEKITALQHMGYTVIPVSTRQFSDFDVFKNVVVTIRQHLGRRDRYAASVYLRRYKAHEALLRDELDRRLAPSLVDTARWQFLMAHM